MLRRLALTLVPSVAIYAVAACLTSALTPRLERTLTRPAAPAAPAPRLAARSGYIVASS